MSVRRVNCDCDVVVIGGGINGLFSAYYLRRNLGLAVTIIEAADHLGAGSSRGNGGQVLRGKPLPAPGMVAAGLRNWFSPTSAFYVKPTRLLEFAPFLLRFALNSRAAKFRHSFEVLDSMSTASMELFDQLLEDGVGTLLRPFGNLVCFDDRAEAEASHESVVRYAAEGLSENPGELLDRSHLLAQYPGFGERARWGYVRNGVRWGDPSTVVDQLGEALRASGVEIIVGSAVDELEESSTAVRIRHRGGDIHARYAVVAAGSDTNTLLRTMGSRLRMAVGKGYSFTVRPEKMPDNVLVLEGAHVGATPLDSARLRIAGILEFGTGATVDQRRIRAIVESARPWLSGIDWGAREDEWAGLRPMTADGLPYVGFAPRSRRTLVASGHNMLGLSLGPATGQAIAELVGGEGSRRALVGFEPERKL